MYAVRNRNGKIVFEAAAIDLVEQGLRKVKNGGYSVTGPDTDAWCRVRWGIFFWTGGIRAGEQLPRGGRNAERWFTLKKDLRFAAVDFTDESVIFRFGTGRFKKVLLDMAVKLKRLGREIVRLEPNLLEVKNAEGRVPSSRLKEFHREHPQMDDINLALFFMLMLT